MLLRATHFPYMFAIWMYERARRHWKEKKGDWLHGSGTQKRSMLANHISSSHRATKYPAMHNRSEASLMAKTPGSAGRAQSAKDPDVVAELNRVLEKLNTQEEMIAKLSRQVEKLTWPYPSVAKAKADAIEVKGHYDQSERTLSHAQQLHIFDQGGKMFEDYPRPEPSAFGRALWFGSSKIPHWNDDIGSNLSDSVHLTVPWISRIAWVAGPKKELMKRLSL
ncbi:MAG: hypothetical protein Q9216_002824 [Gyalolechia sp. 2 TL-2023]